MPSTRSHIGLHTRGIGASRFAGALAGAVGAPAGNGERALCSPVDYALPGAVPAIKQQSEALAWAAQVTVMLSWRDDVAYTEREALQSVHPRWVRALESGQALDAEQTAVLLATAGLCVAQPQCLASEGWEAMLRTYGPLAILSGEGDVSLSGRGRIVFGVSGDGTREGTRLQLVDTSTGIVQDKPLRQFDKDVRLLHWNADASASRGRHPTAPAAVEPSVTAGTPSISIAAQAAAAIPAWDRPENFPTEVRRFWADLNSRLHHFVWHDARTRWPRLAPEVRRAFDELGFSPPPRLHGQPGAGVDFLHMHRQMMAATRAVAARHGLIYRPIGWNPIPWDHNHAVWPMPVWPSPQPTSKTEERTLEMRALVRDRFHNARWLAGVSLDQLGSLLEDTIHNWMHMHWAQPQPSAAELRRSDISNDWLGSTFTSQVNPIFWKLHGWIDECIERWERAPAEAGTGVARSAAADLARFAWVGPVPRALAQGAGAGHHHPEIPKAKLDELIAAIDFTAHNHFATADMSTPKLVAMLGPIGDIPQGWRDEVRGAGRSMIASISGPMVPVGWERHAVRQLAGPALPAIGLGLAAFNTIRALAEAGDVSYESAIAEYVHPHTPPETPATRTTMDLRITAHHPRYLNAAEQHFFFELRFDHNGHDLKNCQVELLRKRSASLSWSSFHIAFRPVATSAPQDPVAVITYQITGRWDPYGSGDYSFQGELVLRATGEVTLAITRADENRVWARNAFSNIRRVPLPAPVVVTPWHDVMFSPANSDKVTDTEERSLLDWLSAQLTPPVRADITGGRTPIKVTGFASTTGTLQHNRELSDRRAQNVARILRHTLGPNAVIETIALGKAQTPPPDQIEDPAHRRARVEFRRYIWPSGGGAP